MSANDENLVIVGKKATLNYVVACLTLFNSGAEQIKIKARGLTISRAIETVEMLKNSFLKDLKINNIAIGSQNYNKLGKSRRISTIEIDLTKT